MATDLQVLRCAIWEERLMPDHEHNAGVVCDNCGTPDPPLTTEDGRFCDQACADAYALR